MLSLYLHFLAFLTLSSGQSGIPQYFQRQWIGSDDNSQYDDDIDARPIGVEMWPETSTKSAELTPAEDGTPLDTTTIPHTTKHQEANEVVEESSVWIIALVVAVLLVLILGSISLAYYLCVWRGGRIYYQPQKEGYP